MRSWVIEFFSIFIIIRNPQDHSYKNMEMLKYVNSDYLSMAIQVTISLTPDQKAWLDKQPRTFKLSKFVRVAMIQLTDFEREDTLPMEA